jgi:hypothetical protein
MKALTLRAAPLLAGVGLALFLAQPSGWAQAKQPFSVTGSFVEACSCSPPCACELTGLVNGCQGLGAVSLTTARYMGADVSGTRIAYATVPGSWVRLYVEVRSPAQRKAAEALAKAIFQAFGKVEAVKTAKVEVTGTGGKYTVSVDGGKTMKFVTEPILGGDKRTPIGHTNVQNPIVSTVYQGKAVSGTYEDGERKIELSAGNNSYFNSRVRKTGSL